jgi:hypothetical protein
MSIHATLTVLLPRTELFAGLGTEEIADAAALFREVRFARGELLFSRLPPRKGVS